jgi:hypothetical protein
MLGTWAFTYNIERLLMQQEIIIGKEKSRDIEKYVTDMLQIMELAPESLMKNEEYLTFGIIKRTRKVIDDAAIDAFTVHPGITWDVVYTIKGSFDPVLSFNSFGEFIVNLCYGIRNTDSVLLTCNEEIRLYNSLMIELKKTY